MHPWVVFVRGSHPPPDLLMIKRIQSGDPRMEWKVTDPSIVDLMRDLPSAVAHAIDNKTWASDVWLKGELLGRFSSVTKAIAIILMDPDMIRSACADAILAAGLCVPAVTPGCRPVVTPLLLRPVVIVAHSHGSIIVECALDQLAHYGDTIRIITLGAARTLYHPAFHGRIHNFQFLNGVVSNGANQYNWDNHPHRCTPSVRIATQIPVGVCG
jgi:hypothetical protein